MKSTTFGLLACTCLGATHLLHGQDISPSDQATVWLSKAISNHNSEKPLPKPAPDFSHHVIKNTVINRREDRTVIFREIESPPQAEPIVRKTRTTPPLSEVELEKLRAEIKPARFVSVGASIFSHGKRKLSRIQWRHEGEQYVAISNFSWLHFTGFASYETKDTQYSMLLVASETTAPASIEDLAADLPRLRKEGPMMKIIQGDPDNAEALEPIIALHDLYAEEQGTLKKAYKSRKREARKRQREQEAEKRRNGGKKKDLTLRFWKGEDRPMSNR